MELVIEFHVRLLRTAPFRSDTKTPAYQHEICEDYSPMMQPIVTSSGSLIFSPMLMNFPPLKKDRTTSQHKRLYINGQKDKRRLRTGPNNSSTDSCNARSLHSATYCLIFQFSASSSFLKAIQQLLTSSSSYSHRFYPSLYIPFNKVFQKAVPTQDMTNPVTLPSVYCMYDIPLLLYSFFTRSDQLISTNSPGQ